MRILPLHDEPIILQQLSEGDESAFEKVFAHYWDIIYSTALRFTKSVDLAQDITQDVFAQLWMKREMLPGVRKFEGFIFVLTRNIIFDQMRRNVLSGKMDEYYKLYFRESETFSYTGVEAKDLRAVIEEAIRSMPAKQQVAFRLSRFEGLSYEEIAREMNISRLSVKNYIVRSLLALRQLLGNRRSGFLLVLIWLVKIFFSI